MSVSRHKHLPNSPESSYRFGAVMSPRTAVGAAFSRNLVLDCRLAVALADGFSTIQCFQRSAEAPLTIAVAPP
jgi:hypothetical protein